MKINTKQFVADLDGNPMKIMTGIGDDGQAKVEDATLKRVVTQALWNPIQGDEQLPVETKIKHDELARLFHANDELDLLAEDVALVKARINKSYSHVGIVAGALRLIDPPKLKALA